MKGDDNAEILKLIRGSIGKSGTNRIYLRKRSAVAIILRLQPEFEVLYIKRVTRENDRWSGQVAFPGGHTEKDDVDDIATAVRETKEEIGLDLNSEPFELLGRLDDLRVMSLPIALAPIIFLQKPGSKTPRLSLSVDEGEYTQNTK